MSQAIRHNIQVCLSTELIHLFEVKDKTVVVVNVLRATSTICQILKLGAKAVIPVSSIDTAKQFNHNEYILAAEQAGEPVDGFEFGNSPSVYSYAH